MVEYLYGIRSFHTSVAEASCLVGCEAMRALRSFETSGATHVQRHILKDLKSQWKNSRNYVMEKSDRLYQEEKWEKFVGLCSSWMFNCLSVK